MLSFIVFLVSFRLASRIGFVDWTYWTLVSSFIFLFMVSCAILN